MKYGTTEREILAIVQEAYEDEDTDLHVGGVPMGVIAERADLSQRQTAKFVRPLARKGELEQVWGVGRDTGLPRKSYIPTGVSDE